MTIGSSGSVHQKKNFLPSLIPMNWPAFTFSVTPPMSYSILTGGLTRKPVSSTETALAVAEKPSPPTAMADASKAVRGRLLITCII